MVPRPARSVHPKSTHKSAFAASPFAAIFDAWAGVFQSNQFHKAQALTGAVLMAFNSVSDKTPSRFSNRIAGSAPMP